MNKYNLEQLRGAWGAGHANNSINGTQPQSYYFKLKKKWFHSFEDGKVQYQGQTLDYDPNSQMCLIQFYEWVVGAPSNEKLISIHDMKDWIFYDTDEEMRDAYTHKIAPRERDIIFR